MPASEGSAVDHNHGSGVGGDAPVSLHGQVQKEKGREGKGENGRGWGLGREEETNQGARGGREFLALGMKGPEWSASGTDGFSCRVASSNRGRRECASFAERSGRVGGVKRKRKLAFSRRQGAGFPARLEISKAVSVTEAFGLAATVGKRVGERTDQKAERSGGFRNLAGERPWGSESL